MIVGNRGGTNIGGSLERAAVAEGITVLLTPAVRAWESNRLLQKWNWWVRGRRPSRLASFSQDVLSACRDFRPDLLIATGIAPIESAALADIQRLGIRRLNYLTDDPWNPAHEAPWFLEALPEYDVVFSPRLANLDPLRRHGCRGVEYLMFGFDPELHFPEPPADDQERRSFDRDVVFAGGADSERAVYIGALIRSHVTLGLYGSYWERYRQTRGVSRGQADLPTLRKAVTGARVGICLVRRANRDDHSMRTFEIPAVGTCPVVEDTPTHRELFGEEGESALFFTTPQEMVDRVREALRDPARRSSLARAAHVRILEGAHTYRDRLKSMLARGQAA